MGYQNKIHLSHEHFYPDFIYAVDSDEEFCKIINLQREQQVQQEQAILVS